MLGLIGDRRRRVDLRRRDRLARDGARQGHEGDLRSVPDLRPDRHGRGRRVRHLRLLQHAWAANWEGRWPVATCTAINQSDAERLPERDRRHRLHELRRLPARRWVEVASRSRRLRSAPQALSRRRARAPRGAAVAPSVRSARRARPASRRRSGTTSRCRRPGRRSRRPPTAPARRPPSRCGDRARAAPYRRRARRPPRPVTTKPSGRSSTATPARRSSRAMATMRSDSLTRSSARSANTVSPSASAAATASAGISSMRAQRQLARDVRRRAGATRARAPPDRLAHARLPRRDLDVGAHRRAARPARPTRVGLSPTFSTVTSLPATVAAATNRNVADDRSPGITIGIAAQPAVPAVRIDDHGAAAARRRRSARPSRAACVRCDRASAPARAAWSAPLRLQSGEHQRALELGARDREVVARCRRARRRARAAAGRRRRDAAGSTRPSTVAPMLAQRLGHAPHRPPRQRRVADQLGLERAARRAGPSAGGSWCPSCRSRARPPPPSGPRSRRPGCAPRRRPARSRRPARAAPPPSTGCPRPGRGRAPRRRRPRAPRTAARGARSTCRRGPGRCRAAVPIAGPSASSVSAGHRCFTTTSTPRASAASGSSRAPAARRSSFSASPSRWSAPMCRRTWTRDPSARQRQAVEHRREPEQHDHLLPRVACARHRSRSRPRVAACPRLVEQRERRRGPDRRPGSAARRSAAARREGEQPRGARPHAVGHRDRDGDRGRILVGVERAAQLAQRPAARVGERRPRRRRSAPRTRGPIALRDRARRDQRDRPPLLPPTAGCRRHSRRGRARRRRAGTRVATRAASKRPRAMVSVFGPPVASVPATSRRSASVNTS